MFGANNVKQAERIERIVKWSVVLAIILGIVGPSWWYYHKSTTDITWITAAPKGTEYAEFIETPSGNIFCQLSNDFVGCTILNRDYSYNGEEDCEGDHFSYVLKSGKRLPHRKCDAVYIGEEGSRTKLDYGDYIQSEKFVCRSEKEKLACWEKSTGYGLAMNKDEYGGYSK